MRRCASGGPGDPDCFLRQGQSNEVNLGDFQFVEALHQKVVQVYLLHHDADACLSRLRGDGGEGFVPVSGGEFTAPNPEHRP